MSTPVAHADNDEAELGQRDVARPGRERFRHAFSLRTRIDVGDDRIQFCLVEIERLVYNPVDVGDSIVRFNLESLRKLEPGLHELRQISRFQFEEEVAQVVAKHGLGHSIDTGVIVDEKPVGVAHAGVMIKVALVEQPESCAVQINLVQVVIVGIFTLLAAVGSKIHDPVLFIDSHDTFTVPGSGCDLFFQVSVAVKEIKMCPPVSFRPVDEFFSVVDQSRWTDFDIGVEPFFDQDF